MGVNGSEREQWEQWEYWELSKDSYSQYSQLFPVFPVLGQVLLHVDGGAAASGGSHDGLAVVRVGNVTGSKYTLDIGGGVMAL